MKNWSFTAIGLGGLFVVLLAQLPATLSKFDSQKTINEYLPDKWRAISPEFKPPQIEIHMLRGHVSKNTGWSTNLEYALSNNYDEIPPEKQNSEEDKKKDETPVTKKPSKLGRKTVIQVPSFQCPPGQKTDHLGRCREIL